MNRKVRCESCEGVGKIFGASQDCSNCNGKGWTEMNLTAEQRRKFNFVVLKEKENGR